MQTQQSMMKLYRVIVAIFAICAASTLVLHFGAFNCEGVVSEHATCYASALEKPRAFARRSNLWSSGCRSYRFGYKTANHSELLADNRKKNIMSNQTLRQYLTHPDGFHLAMAPAFFGFYAYFGALITLDEEVGILDLQVRASDSERNDESSNPVNERGTKRLLKSAVGASAGAMAAVILAAGVKPRDAADFASSFKLADFADPPGIISFMKGDKFERIMSEFLNGHNRTTTTASGFCVGHKQGACAHHNSVSVSRNEDTDTMLEKNECMETLRRLKDSCLRLEDGILDVAVTGFDLKRLAGKVLTRGCMAKAARASATFPGLFQPVKWKDQSENGVEENYLLLDGGVADSLGLRGLSAIPMKDKRVVNLVVGSFGLKSPTGPSKLSSDIGALEIVSISVVNTPRCGPWAMPNGPRAVEATRRALFAALDTPMMHGNEEGHFILHVDASAYSK